MQQQQQLALQLPPPLFILTVPDMAHRLKSYKNFKRITFPLDRGEWRGIENIISNKDDILIKNILYYVLFYKGRDWSLCLIVHRNG